MQEIWCEWSDMNAFENWHTQIKTQLGLPKPSQNQATGEMNQNAQWTIDYTTPIQLADAVIAKVEEQFTETLEITDKRPPIPNHLLETQSYKDNA